VLAQIFLLIGITAVMTTLTICAHRSSFLLTYCFATVCLLPSRMEPISENSQCLSPRARAITMLPGYWNSKAVLATACDRKIARWRA